MTKWTADLTALNGRRCEIYYDKYAGYYLNVWIDGKDTYDYLQDTLEIAKKQALRDFGVPLDAWREVEDE